MIKNIKQEPGETFDDLKKILRDMFSVIPGDPVRLEHAYRVHNLTDKKGRCAVRATFENSEDVDRVMRNCRRFKCTILR